MDSNQGGPENPFYKPGSPENFKSGEGGFGNEGGPRVPPWEYPEGTGAGLALIQTIRSVLFDPVETFRHMRSTGNLSRVYLFALIINVVVGFITLIVGLVMQSTFIALMKWLDVHVKNFDFKANEIPVYIMFLAFAARILWMFLQPIVTAGVVHGFMLLTGGGTKPFETTFRVTCYSQSALIWSLIPCIGPLISFIWFVICMALGLMEQQRVTAARAIVILLLSYIIACCCLCSCFGVLPGR